ncbi:MAG: VWA domain-containing protein, partial [Pseudomonadota bacterium]
MSSDKSGSLTRGARTPVAPSSSSDVAAFLNKAQSMTPAANGGQNGRLVFALDATLSRQPAWDMACHMQAEMFQEAARVGGLDIQLVYFRGYDECRSSRWTADANELGGMMSRIQTRGGMTQIGKVLTHALKETEKTRVNALVYVGD